ncbi:hypothetical protein PGTUg99_037342 [Puccinia graminis f. sp. tritici]|uniref:Uncharacterized protein n=1 Tax=Puccinia graminis f. sp. tritici TaxID=56615 RepID=A0A5B0MJL2_PUCGR|nr:hypothetical protein PGTUg99_037342 [Puccinia graminis f. sp. tritici]
MGLGIHTNSYVGGVQAGARSLAFLLNSQADLACFIRVSVDLQLWTPRTTLASVDAPGRFYRSMPCHES